MLCGNDKNFQKIPSIGSKFPSLSISPLVLKMEDQDLESYFAFNKRF